MAVMAVKTQRSKFAQLRMRALLFGVECEPVDTYADFVYADLVGTEQKCMHVATGYADVLDVAEYMPV